MTNFPRAGLQAGIAAQRPRLAFWIAFVSLFVVGFGNSMLLAVLPPIARAIGMPDSTVGAVFSVSALLWVVASPFWGRLSDRVGRKPVMVTGLWAYGASMGGFALVAAGGLAGTYGVVATFIGMTLTRAIFGAVGSATSPAAQAYIADLSPPSRRLQQLAALTSAFALGSAVGPAVCAWLAGRFGFLSPLTATTALAVATAMILMLQLPASAPVQGGDERQAPSWRLAWDSRVRAYLLYAVGVSLVTGVLVQTFAFFTMDRLGVQGPAGAQLSAAGFSAHALALLFTQLVVLPRLPYGPRWLMVVGAACAAGGVLIQIQAGSLAVLVLAQVLQGLGFGLARPGFTSGASLAVSPTEQGAVAGLVVAANGAGFILSPLFGNGLYELLGMDAPLWLVIAVLLGLSAYAGLDRSLRLNDRRRLPAGPAPE